MQIIAISALTFSAPLYKKYIINGSAKMYFRYKSQLGYDVDSYIRVNDIQSLSNNRLRSSFT